MMALTLILVRGVTTLPLGVDIAAPLTPSQWSCLASANVSWAVVRAWHSYGAFDRTALTNIRAATAANISTDIYMFPCRGMDPTEQAKSMIHSLGNASFNFAWLDVEMNPSHVRPRTSNSHALL